MKTIKEWFEELEEPYRSQALFNHIKEHGGETDIVKNLEDALYSGFSWNDSPEGHNYWSELTAVFRGVQREITLTEWEKKLKTLLESLEVQNIDHLMDNFSVEDYRDFGEEFVKVIKGSNGK